jgi:hypothetical protein
MKYLVATSEGPGFSTADEMVAILEGAVLPGFDQLSALEKSGTIVGGLPIGSRSFVFIMEADTSDEVDRILRSLTMWPALEWEVTALQSIQSRADIEREILSRIKNGA